MLDPNIIWPELLIDHCCCPLPLQSLTKTVSKERMVQKFNFEAFQKKKKKRV